MESDPYEARLYQMFKGCDKNNSGLLDEAGVRALCEELELGNDKGENLLATILEKNDTKINFEIFKECLLSFLGGGNDFNSAANTSCLNYKRTLVLNDGDAVKQQIMESPPDSSDREVSPKLVMGSKKYGRRSRPPYRCSKEILLSDSEDDCILIDGSRRFSKTVERSSSQTDIASSRHLCAVEQSGAKLKRCASLPAQRNQNHVRVGTGAGFLTQKANICKHKSTKAELQKKSHKSRSNDMTQSQLESAESSGHDILSSTIREVWQSYSAEVGSSFLTCTQLRVVCERLGLQAKLAERVAFESFDQLHSCQYNQLISLQDFIKLLECSTTSLNGRATAAASTIDAVLIQSHEIFDSNKISSKEDLTHMETLPVDRVIDIWEQAHIPNGRNILTALGFDEPVVRLAHLHKIIDEEVRGLEEEQAMTLLRASTTLQNAELSGVRQMLHQIHDENVKLRADNKEANKRVALMAMEIDERHAMLEENSRKEAKTLEQRHASAIRELNERMANDREHWANIILKLEERIKVFSQSETRLKNELELIRKENEELESKQLKLLKENEQLLRNSVDFNAKTSDKSKKSKQLSSETEVNNCSFATSDTDDELVRLMEKLEAFRSENHKLRDKNDELAIEVENLNMELQRYQAEIRKRTSLVTSTTTKASYNAAESGTEDNSSSETMAIATKRRGDSPSKTHTTEESPRTGKLRKCVNDDDSETSLGELALNAELEQQHEKNSQADVIKTLRERVYELEKLLKTPAVSDETLPVSSNCAGEKCEHAIYIERCKELEASLEQMAAAYDDCEKYWQSKVNEERQNVDELQMKLKTERQLFDEQRMFYDDVKQESDNKFTELMEKIREYEEQFAKDNRLTPIEERDTLEQQYADLETELKMERDANELQAKEVESLKKDIEALHNQIEYLRLNEFAVAEECVLPPRRDPRQESPASSPISYLWHQSTIQQPAKLVDEKKSAGMAASTTTAGSPNRHRNCITLSTTELSTFSTPPNTSTSSPTSQNACISPIQKPGLKALAAETDDNGAAGDCDTTSTASGKSLDTQSVLSTQSEKGGDVSGGSAGGRAESAHTQPSNEEKRTRSPASFRDELKRLKFLEISLKEQIKDLSFQRDGLVMELQQLQEARPVLEKAYARTAHPNLTQRISQLELRNRHLQNVIKQQQQYSESMMQQSWRQYQTEMNELHGRIDAQVAMITDQGQRLQNADMLVKDLYVENSHLTAAVQRLEQQRLRISMMQQQQHQQQQQPLNMHQLQSLNILPGMP